MLRLHDIRTRQVEPIVPAGSRIFRMYICGPAPHRYALLGDLRTHLFADLVRRVAERRRLRVVACQGIDDIGGPDGEPSPEAARAHEDAFFADALALNIHRPEHTPRAGETVGPVIELIARLIERGHAYAAPGGGVYFDAASFPSYGELSGVARGDAGGDAAGRRSDLALWAPRDGEPAWDSPWGRGAPRREVTCSAMALHSLGDRVDLRVGGPGPHHREAERALSAAATGHEVVRHWAEGERLLTDLPLTDIVAGGLDPLAVRLALLERHYRAPARLTWDALRAADATLRRWRRRVAEWAESPSRPIDAGYAGRIDDAFDDDLDVPLASRLLGELERDDSVAAGSRFETFLHVDHVLGLDLSAEIGRAPVGPVEPAEPLERRFPL
ncbi:cysteine--tRNA ligase [Microbispora sp. RL4-1S]|uniref:Cysteine--tRNA ligase n=1 Tax=Microbispora oryzae TaxID=2806554 RepID=A0A940WL53_9ACTN|nr:cysteine--tRNA ligase [Microbispora oryzae]MBP2707674.1 cysteine--tRNA ligase [Microbispora oryzae]